MSYKFMFLLCNLIFNIFTASNIRIEGFKIRGFTLEFAVN